MGQSSVVYESDYVAWATSQSQMIKQGNFSELDIEHLADEVFCLGNSERNKLESHLAIWLMHQLKIIYQPEKHTKSWDLSIKNAKYQFFRCLKKNPSLKSELAETLDSSYHIARWRALDETGLFEQEIPEECVFNLDDLMKE